MDIADVRAQNVKQILNALRFAEGYTKKEIYQITGLSLSTVSATCNALEAQNVLMEKKIKGGNVGRNPAKLTFLCEQFYGICLCLHSRDAMSLSILDFNNRVLFSKRYNIAGFATITDIIAGAAKTYLDISCQEPFRRMTCAGVGVSVPGVFDEATGRLIYSTAASWEDAPLRNIVADCFGLPCYVNTRSNYCALAIRQKNAGASNFLYLFLDSEINAGVICNGELLNGQNNHSLRIAHLPLGDAQKRCSLSVCAQNGCINTDISLPGMVGDYQNYDSPEATLERWDAMVEEIRKTPERFGHYLAEKGAYIGKLASLLICIFDPAVLYLGGRCTQIFEQLRPAIMAEVESRCPLACEFGVRVVWDDDSDLTLNRGIVEMIYDNWNPLAPANDIGVPQPELFGTAPLVRTQPH